MIENGENSINKRELRVKELDTYIIHARTAATTSSSCAEVLAFDH